MEKLQAQVDTWTTRFNEMEEKFTLLNEHFLAKLKEKEDIIACLQKYLQQSLDSNGAFCIANHFYASFTNFESQNSDIGIKIDASDGIWWWLCLGKNGHGIVHPIQPMMRQQKPDLVLMGLHFH
jgi:hypothetical protein